MNTSINGNLIYEVSIGFGLREKVFINLKKNVFLEYQAITSYGLGIV